MFDFDDDMEDSAGYGNNDDEDEYDDDKNFDMTANTDDELDDDAQEDDIEPSEEDLMNLTKELKEDIVDSLLKDE